MICEASATPFKTCSKVRNLERAKSYGYHRDIAVQSLQSVFEILNYAVLSGSGLRCEACNNLYKCSLPQAFQTIELSLQTLHVSGDVFVGRRDTHNHRWNNRFDAFRGAYAPTDHIGVIQKRAFVAATNRYLIQKRF
uniref:Uncharacterized protein n=1 Tax=Romanomermis culicivorax TaxID=13658 RepID=A0A915IMK7_ROMCU